MVGFRKVIEQKEDKGGMGKGDKDTFHLKLKHIVADKKRGFKIKDKNMKKINEKLKRKRGKLIKA